MKRRLPGPGSREWKRTHTRSGYASEREVITYSEEGHFRDGMARLKRVAWLRRRAKEVATCPDATLFRPKGVAKLLERSKSTIFQTPRLCAPSHSLREKRVLSGRFPFAASLLCTTVFASVSINIDCAAQWTSNPPRLGGPTSSSRERCARPGADSSGTGRSSLVVHTVAGLAVQRVRGSDSGNAWINWFIYIGMRMKVSLGIHRSRNIWKPFVARVDPGIDYTRDNCERWFIRNKKQWLKWTNNHLLVSIECIFIWSIIHSIEQLQFFIYDNILLE